MTTPLIQSSALALALTAATLLGACGRDDARENARTSGSAAGQQGSSQAGSDNSRAGGSAADSAGTATSDVAITAAVKTLLAADAQLRATDINVDTNAGRVALRGTAPDAATRARATEMARSVAGVVDVDNTLTVQATAN